MKNVIAIWSIRIMVEELMSPCIAEVELGIPIPAIVFVGGREVVMLLISIVVVN